MGRKRKARARLGAKKKIRSNPAPRAGAKAESAEKSPKESGVGPQISPLAPKSFASLPPLAGVRLATRPAGIKYRDPSHVPLMVLPPHTHVPSVLTQSQNASAPVDWG